MNIYNDKLVFDSKDFGGLSEFAKKALTGYFGERTSIEQVFSDLVNAQIFAAKQNLKQTVLDEPEVDSFVKNLAALDKSERLAVLATIETP